MNRHIVYGPKLVTKQVSCGFFKYTSNVKFSQFMKILIFHWLIVVELFNINIIVGENTNSKHTTDHCNVI